MKNELAQAAEKIASMVEWYSRGSASQDDRSVVGDMTDLYQRGSIIRDLIDAIMTLQHCEQNRVEAREKLGDLVAEVENLGAIVRDLSGPLRRITYGLSHATESGTTG